MMKAGPLAGIRVLELGTNLSAPLATMTLGDQGASVIKIETPAGDQLRYSGARREGVRGLNTMFLNANRNKRSIALDLKRPEELAAAQGIAAQCDVVVQNYRPGVAERLGLDYATLRALRPDIIYVSIDGLGRDGPGAKRKVYDIVVQGIAGFAAAQAGGAEGEPTTMKTTVIDKTTALVAAQAATAALLVRERTGEGQHITVSMLDVALSFLWPEIMGSTTLIGEGVVPGGSLAAVRYCHRTANGHILVGYVSNDEFAALCRVIGRADLIDDPRFADIGQRFAAADALNELIAAALVTRPTEYWLPLLEAADGIYAPVNSPEQVIADPLVRHAGSLTVHEHPLAGTYRQPVHPARFGGTPATLRRHAPALNEHRAEVLAEFGITLEERP